MWILSEVRHPEHTINGDNNQSYTSEPEGPSRDNQFFKSFPIEIRFLSVNTFGEDKLRLSFLLQVLNGLLRVDIMCLHYL